jgi:hypothetical protein
MYLALKDFWYKENFIKKDSKLEIEDRYLRSFLYAGFIKKID